MNNVDKLIKLNDELRTKNKQMFERQTEIDRKYNKIIRKIIIQTTSF